jgi:hypothetical protein
MISGGSLIIQNVMSQKSILIRIAWKLKKTKAIIWWLTAYCNSHLAYDVCAECDYTIMTENYTRTVMEILRICGIWMQYNCNNIIILKNSRLFPEQLNLLLLKIDSVGFWSGSVNLKQVEAVDMPVPSNTHSTSNVETKGRSFLTNQTRVTGVQDVITRMKNADQGDSWYFNICPDNCVIINGFVS